MSLHVEFQPSRMLKLHIFFSSDFFYLGKKSFHVEFHPPGLPGTGQKVCGGWVVVVVVVVVV